MIVTIFGATGLVGKQLVNEALLMGHTVKAYGRNVYSANFVEQKNLQLVVGALFDAGQVGAAVKGSDVVLSALGGATDGTDSTRSLGMKYIVEAMEKHSVKRIVAIGGIGILDAEEEGKMFEKDDFPEEFLPVSWEHDKALKILEASKLDWTMVCPPMIKDAEVTGSFSTAENKMPTDNKFGVNGGDVALFMLNEMTRDEFIKKRVGITN